MFTPNGPQGLHVEKPPHCHCGSRQQEVGGTHMVPFTSDDLLLSSGADLKQTPDTCRNESNAAVKAVSRLRINAC